MRIVWFSEAWQDYVDLQNADRDLADKINALIKDTARDPFRGLGKPEPLRGELSGWWSRRVTREHRFVYRVSGSGHEQRLEIIGCRYHYSF